MTYVDANVMNMRDLIISLNKISNQLEKQNELIEVLIDLKSKEVYEG